MLASVAPLLAVPPAAPGLPWPPAVLARGGPFAGLLAAVAPPFVVLGVGLPVPPAPAAVAPAAPSLLALGVAAPARPRLARRLLRALAARLLPWRPAPPPLAAASRARRLPLGSRVRVALPGGPAVVGIARALAAPGRLCLAV
ncbi:hypothetical protein C3R44_22960, partial [Mycobacterium tuberculosis]